MISSIIETLDCRYLFSNTNVKKAKKALEEGVEKPKLLGALDIFEGM